jgi:hydroxymethylpyrimidine pyrophosphatase-like HAD family hydrolase
LFDLDDTIVYGGSHISDRVLRALGRASEADIVCSIASGRPLCLVNRKILALKVFPYAVCANGAKVYDLTDGSVIFSGSMDTATALAAFHALEPMKPAWNAFIGDRAYFEWKGTSYMITGLVGRDARQQARAEAETCGEEGHRARKGAAEKALSVFKRGARFFVRMIADTSVSQVLDIKGHLRRTASVDKMGASFRSGADCERGMAILAADGRFEVARMGMREIEITRKGVTKATGALELMRYLGIDPKDTVAFGDGGNDLPLAEVTGSFVAVANADADVKAKATYVCPSIKEDGVAVWIEDRLAASGRTMDKAE